MTDEPSLQNQPERQPSEHNQEPDIAPYRRAIKITFYKSMTGLICLIIGLIAAAIGEVACHWVIRLAEMAGVKVAPWFDTLSPQAAAIVFFIFTLVTVWRASNEAWPGAHEHVPHTSTSNVPGRPALPNVKAATPPPSPRNRAERRKRRH